MSFSKMLKYTGDMVPIIVKYICRAPVAAVCFFSSGNVYSFSSLHSITSLPILFLDSILQQIPKCHFCTTFLTCNSFLAL